MAAISILEFLRTGNFGFVHIGMSRSEVIANLGVPDWYYPDDDMSAGFWSYGGVQLFFDSSVNLNRISFKSKYFYKPNPTDIKVDPWIFKNGYQPNKQKLIMALQKESIEVKDTGILLLVQSGKTGKSKYIRSKSDLQPNDKLDKEDSGFLVLKSGIEVLYAGNNVLPNVAGHDGANKVTYIKIAVGGMFTFENETLEHLRSSW